MFIVIALTAFDVDHFAGLRAVRRRRSRHGGRHDLLLVHRPRRRVHRGRRGEGPAEDHAARAHRRARHRHQRLRAGGRRRPSAPSPWQDFEGQAEAGLSRRSWRTSRRTPCGARSSPLGAVISIFSVTLVTMYGQTRILFAMGRDGMLPRHVRQGQPADQTPVNNTIIVAIVVAILAAFVPLDYLIDVVSIGTLTAFIVVSLGVIILRYREPDLPRGLQGAAASRSRRSCRSSPAPTSWTACTGTPGCGSPYGCLPRWSST